MTDQTIARIAFEKWVQQEGTFTDWSRYGDGYARPLVDRTWRAWLAGIEWSRRNGELSSEAKK